MKKVILGSVLAAAAAASINAQAAVTAVCTGAAGGMSATVTAGTNFVKTQFTAKCSANVALVGDDGSTYYRVGAVSTKGKNAFAGTTAGGGVTATGCAGSPCVTNDASTAAGSAVTS